MARRTSAVAVLSLMAAVLVPASVAGASGCTRVIGGSQTTNWYVNGRYETRVVDAEWERQTSGGQNISTWGVGGTGWTVPVGSACTPAGALPTRVVVHVLPTGLDTTVEGISGHIRSALDGIAANLPSATRITLIPPVAGIGCDHINLSAWQPNAVAAIEQNLSDTVDAGPAVIVPDCSYFKDVVGHLTGTGADWVAAEYAATLPDDTDPPPPPPGEDVTPPTVSITSPATGAAVSRSILVTMTAGDDVGVTSVDLNVDGALAGTVTASPYQVRWDSRTVADGDHTLTAVARDAAGNATTSAPVTVTVANAAPPPPPPPPPGGDQFTASATTVPLGTAVVFTDAHPGSHRRVYTFGDGTSLSVKAATASHTYLVAGVFTATLESIDLATGTRATFSLTITVTG